MNPNRPFVKEGMDENGEWRVAARCTKCGRKYISLRKRGFPCMTGCGGKVYRVRVPKSEVDRARREG